MIAGILLIWALVSTGLLIIAWYWVPYLPRLMLSRRLVWLLHPDGTMEPVAAKLEGVAYKTKDRGIFEYEKEDVFLFGNKPSIIVYSPYSKAIRPKVLPILQKLKEIGVERYDQLMVILNSEIVKVVGEEEVEESVSSSA